MLILCLAEVLFVALSSSSFLIACLPFVAEWWLYLLNLKLNLKEIFSLIPSHYCLLWWLWTLIVSMNCKWFFELLSLSLLGLRVSGGRWLAYKAHLFATFQLRIFSSSYPMTTCNIWNYLVFRPLCNSVLCFGWFELLCNLMFLARAGLVYAV